MNAQKKIFGVLCICCSYITIGSLYGFLNLPQQYQNYLASTSRVITPVPYWLFAWQIQTQLEIFLILTFMFAVMTLVPAKMWRKKMDIRL